MRTATAFERSPRFLTARAAGFRRPSRRQALTGPSCWNARARNRKSTMLPSCGWSQFSLIVGIGPMFRRSMCVASMSARWNFLSSVIADHTSVGPIFSSILSCGHFTTVQNGNMYSFFAIAVSGEALCMIVGRM